MRFIMLAGISDVHQFPREKPRPLGKGRKLRETPSIFSGPILCEDHDKERKQDENETRFIFVRALVA